MRGASGVGKSSLLCALAGLYPAWGGELEGEVFLGEVPLASLGAGERLCSIGFLAQDPAASFVSSRVRDEIAFIPENLGWSRERVDAAVEDVLSRFGIAHLGERAPHTLSGGEQAMVQLAGIAAASPRVILLDEPLSALDTANALRVALALSLLKAGGTSLVIAEHRSALLSDLADRELFLGDLSGADLCVSPRPPLPPLAPGRNGPGSPACVLSLEGVDISPGGERLLSGVSFSLGAGEALCLTGPNGAGKTSLLRAAASLAGLQRGRVVVAGRLRLVDQSPVEHFCTASVREELLVDLRRSGLSLQERRAKAASCLEGLGLAGFEDRSPFLLSEGEKRRLALSSALASSPGILLLDEITAGLDGHSRALVVSELVRYRAGGGAILCVTHDPELCADLGAAAIALPGPWRAEPPPLPGPEDPPAVSPVPARGPSLDPRVSLLLLAALVVVALKPLPPVCTLGFFLLVLGSCLLFPGDPGRSRRGFLLNPVWPFLGSIGLAWAVPGLLLALLVSLDAAVSGCIRLALVSLLVWHWARCADTASLPALLTSWKIPYSAGFAVQASIARVPAFTSRAARIHGLLSLRVSPFCARRGPWNRGSWRRGSRITPGVLRHLFVPIVVQMWGEAERLAMNLELRGFSSRCPSSRRPQKLPLGERGLVAVFAVAIALLVLV